MKTKTKPKRKQLPVPPSAKAMELRTLAKTANDAHKRTIQSGQELLEAAVECGNALIEAKEVAGHGNWLAWLEKNCREISDDTAQRYMRIAREGVKNAQSISHAYRLTGIIVLPPTPKTIAHTEPRQIGAGNGEQSNVGRYMQQIGIVEKPEPKAEEPAAKPEPVKPSGKAATAPELEPKGKGKKAPVLEPAGLGILKKLSVLVGQVMDEVTVLERLDTDAMLIRKTLSPVFQWGNCRGVETE